MYAPAILIAQWSWALDTPVFGGPFDLRAALIVFAVVAVAAAVIIAAAILMPGIGIVAGASLVQTCIEVGAIAIATGMIAGVAAGRYQGIKAARQAEQERIKRVQEIRDVDHFLDIHFLPAQDDPDNARNFACVTVSYDAGDLTSPVVKTQIAAQSAETFYEAVRTEFEQWVRKPINTAAGSRRRHVAIYMRPYPGDGVFERIRALCEQRAEVEISRVDGQWKCRLEKDSPVSTEDDAP